jgi:1-acyl-sn-glycerol-3-phosphate acyltransferase
MIKAEHKKWARLIYDFYISRLLKKNFNSFYLLNEFPSIPKNSGLIITPNHFSWWDGFFIDFIGNKYLDRKIYLLMLEEQLEKYWFFRKIGAFSIKLDNPASIAATLLYSREIISKPENYLVIYPQGELEPYDKRPPKIKEGLVSILKKLPLETFVLPFSFKIRFGNEMKPDVLARAGNLIDSELIVNDYSIFTKAFENTLFELDNNEPQKEKIKFF